MDNGDLEALLKALSYRSRSVEELAGLTGLRPDRLAAALKLSEDVGEVERDPADTGKVRLTSRGNVHLSALEGRRNEGEDHVETLTDLVMWLGTRHIAVTIPEQVAGVLMPDAQFRYGHVVYNVEVECSTVAKAAEQVVRNVKKAREAGNRVLIALPDVTGVPRLLQVLDSAFPELRLWTDGVGMVWKGENGEFHPNRVPGTEAWPFLEGDPAADFDSLEDVDEQVAEDPADQVVHTDPLVHQMRLVIRELLAADKTEATIDELRDRLPVEGRPRASDKRLGKVLALLGLSSRRVKEKGVRFRVYNLAGPTFREGPDGAREGDPSEGPIAIRGPSAPVNGSGRRAPNFTSEDPRGDPSARRDPND